MKADYIKISVGNDYTLCVNKEDIIQKANSTINARELASQNINDSMFYLGFYVPKLKAHFTSIVTIRANGEHETTIRLDTILRYTLRGSIWDNLEKAEKEIKGLTSKEYFNLFEKNVCDIINMGDLKHKYLTIDNKRIYDSLTKPDQVSVEISKKIRIED
jgi:hypothetical protein